MTGTYMKEQLTNQNIRKTNTENILFSILHAGTITRADLARRNDLSVMTVKKIADELMEQGIIQEVVLESSVGRKPRALRLSTHLGAIVCVSLTSKMFFSYTIYNLYGELLEERQRKIDEEYSYRHNLHLLLQRIQLDITKSKLELLGVGVSVPGAYYSEQDLVNCDLISSFDNLHLHQIFSEAFPIDNIQIVHDVFVAAQAEYDLEPHLGSLFYFYVGDGVGGAFVCKDGWHVGEDLVAGEVGQCMVVTEDGESTLEASTCIPYLTQELQKKLPGITFFQALKMYDDCLPEVMNVMDRAAETVARALYNITWTLNPARLVIGCSYQRYAEILVEACERYNRRLATLPIPLSVSVAPAELSKYGEMQGCFHLLQRNWVEQF